VNPYAPIDPAVKPFADVLESDLNDLYSDLIDGYTEL
jgi:hypothetical protein